MDGTHVFLTAQQVLDAAYNHFLKLIAGAIEGIEATELDGLAGLHFSRDEDGGVLVAAALALLVLEVALLEGTGPDGFDDAPQGTTESDDVEEGTGFPVEGLNEDAVSQRAKRLRGRDKIGRTVKGLTTHFLDFIGCLSNIRAAQFDQVITGDLLCVDATFCGIGSHFDFWLRLLVRTIGFV